MARCSFDMHVQDVLGTLICGASLIMLRPHGPLDLPYFVKVLLEKQITYVQSVPSYLTVLCRYLSTQHGGRPPNNLRSICCGGECPRTTFDQHCADRAFCFAGEPLPIQLAKEVHNTILSSSSFSTECRFWNLYGPAETTLDCTYYMICPTANMTTVPLGVPLPNYRCLIVDEFLQPVIVGHDGELLVGGVGVFAGYLGREDLTTSVLINIEGHIFYRTGDLVRLDQSGLLHYVGRKDYQVKLHGQRIELSEIEHCLLDTAISACVVIKWGDDHLVAYVQGKDINVQELREHCQSKLPPFMVPSLFVVLEQMPLNANGKLDRKRLPPPDISSLGMTAIAEPDAAPSQMEERVHELWREVLQQKSDRIPLRTSLFSVGGHSLLLIQLYHRYQSLFGFDTRTLSIGSFLRQATIAEHAQLLETIEQLNAESRRWQPQHIVQGK